MSQETCRGRPTELFATKRWEVPGSLARSRVCLFTMSPVGGLNTGRGLLVKARYTIGGVAGAVILLAVFIWPARAEVSPPAVTRRDTVYHLSEILVEAERIESIADIADRPGFIAIVPMDDASRRVTSAGDRLARTVGFHVRSTGGYGAYSTASLRGSSAQQVKVYLDGVPLHQAQSGMVNLADLPTASLSRIEVYRGYGPFDLSGSNIGGVVNLVTREPGERGGGNVTASYGSLDTKRLGGSYSLSTRAWNFLGLASALATEGDYDFLDDNGTPYTSSDDITAERINNQMDEVEGLAKATGPFAAGTLALSCQLYYRSQGLPGYSTVQSATESMTKKYVLTHAAWHFRDGSGRIPRLDMGLHYLYQIDRFRDDKPLASGGRAGEENRTTSLGATLRWGLPLPSLRQSLRGLVSFTREDFRPQEIGATVVDGETQTRSSVAVSFEDEIHVYRNSVRLVPAIRFESYTDRMTPFESVRDDMAAYFRDMSATEVTHSQPSGSVGLVIRPGAGLTLRANYGRYYRVPSLMELFGYRGMVVPNPGLRPETGLNRDVGIGWNLCPAGGRSLSAEFAYFWSDVDDLIMYTYLTWAGAAQAVNINSAGIHGYEASLSAGGLHGFALSANFTRLKAVDTGPVSYTSGKYLPNRPGLEAHARLAWSGRGLAAFYEYDYVSGNYWNAYNGVAPNNKGPLFDIRRFHTVGITLPTGLAGAAVTLEVRNLTDERVEDVMGYPLPGRSVFATVDVGL
jgi:iron complex outermembrane receptor protein